MKGPNSIQPTLAILKQGMRVLSAIACILLVQPCTGGVRVVGELLAYDDFASLSGGEGFASASSWTATAGASTGLSSDPTGLSFDGLVCAGGAMKLTVQDGQLIRAARPLDKSLNSINELFVSFLWRTDWDGSGSLGQQLELGEWRIGARNGILCCHKYPYKPEVTGGKVRSGETYFIVVGFNKNKKTVQMWVNPHVGAEPPQPTGTTTIGSGDMPVAQAMSFFVGDCYGYGVRWKGHSLWVDEFRIGRSWNDVVVPAKENPPADTQVPTVSLR